MATQYNLSLPVRMFANVSNLFDTPSDVQIFGPSTPEHAQFRQRQTFGSMLTFGIKGSF